MPTHDRDFEASRAASEQCHEVRELCENKALSYIKGPRVRRCAALCSSTEGAVWAQRLLLPGDDLDAQ